MPLVNAILAEIDQEARTTRKVLERVPGDKLTWTPHVKSTPLGKLAWHIAAVPARVMMMIREAEFDLSQAGPIPPPDNIAAILEGFDRYYGEVREFLKPMSDEALKEPFTLRRGGNVVMTVPKIVVVRSILLNHTYHHRGQLSVYLRLLDVPVPSIYGPSADEQM
jgi:uncharacterized damage-inducible protein DinB